MNANLPPNGSPDNQDEDVSPNLNALRVLARLVSAVEHMPMVATLSLDRQGLVRQWNRNSAALYGIPIRDALGRALTDLLFLNDKREEFEATVAQVWVSGEPALSRDWPINTKTGRRLWVYLTMFPVYSEDQADQIFIMGVDVTSRKQEEQALFASGANFRAMFDKSPDAILLIKNNRFIETNSAALALFGCDTKADIVGHEISDFSPPVQPDGQPSQKKLQAMCALAVQHGNHRFEWLHVIAAHHPFWAEKLLTVIEVEGQAQMYAVVRDISERKAAEQSLRLAAQVFEHSREGIMITDQDQRLILVNPAFTKITGYAAQEVLGQTPHLLSSGMHNQTFYQGVWSALAHDDHWEGEIWDRRKNDEPFPVWQSITVVRDSHHHITNYFSIFSDITERQHAQDALLQSEERFRSAFETAAIGMALVGLDGRWLKVNRSTCQILGYTEQELLGMTFQNLTHPDDLRADLNHIRQLLTGELDSFRMEKRYLHKEGHVVWALLSVSLVRDAHGQPVHFVSQILDITEGKEAQSRTLYLAEHDLLTGLPSRELLRGRLRQAIAAAKRNGSQLAILFMDLDHFKNINDSMGHDVGDKLLQEVSMRLNNNVRSVDTVSRQGGDEFVIMLTDIGGIEQVAHVAANMMQALALPHRFDTHEFNITSSIGISLYPSDGEDIDTLIKNADIAMYHAKQSGRNGYQFFSQEMNTRIVERLALESSLRKAIDRHEFVLQYQPETDIVSGQMTGAEALIRWLDPASGLLMYPAHFIAVAEASGLIVPIGDWVLRTACRQAREWQNQGCPLVVSVNISVAQFHQKDLLQSVIDALQLADLAPHYLELELTESILANGVEHALETLSALSKIGVRLAIDDFGTGYSSLSYLKRFSVDKLKIDQSFVHDIVLDVDDAAIVTAIIAMAKQLKLTVTAEGVETAAQFDFLKAHGCNEYQGFYASHALSSQDFSEFMAHHCEVLPH